MKTKLSLLLSTLVILSVVLTACGGGGAPATQPPAATEEPAATEPAATEPAATEPVAAPATFNEAPSLADQGLPPVEERLPDEPVVTDVVDSIGQYGGTIH